MSALPIEERLAILEQEVAILKARVPVTSDNNRAWLDRIYGAFEGKPAFKEAMELGRKYRDSLRPKARKKARKST